MMEPDEPIRVLQVDGDPDFVDVTATFLERGSDRIDVLTATSPGEAPDVPGEYDVDCVVSDTICHGQTASIFSRPSARSIPNCPSFCIPARARRRSPPTPSRRASLVISRRRVAPTSTRSWRTGSETPSRPGGRRPTPGRASTASNKLKTVPPCVVRLDCEGRFVFANDRAVEVLGLGENELTNRSYNDRSGRYSTRTAIRCRSRISRSHG